MFGLTKEKGQLIANTFEENGAKKKGLVDVNLKPSELAGHFTNKK